MHCWNTNNFIITNATKIIRIPERWIIMFFIEHEEWASSIGDNIKYCMFRFSTIYITECGQVFRKRNVLFFHLNFPLSYTV